VPDRQGGSGLFHAPIIENLSMNVNGNIRLIFRPEE
jgi:hypothetical protein